MKKGRLKKCLSGILAMAVAAAGMIELPVSAAPMEPEENPRFINSAEASDQWWCMPSFSTDEGTGLFEFNRNSEPVEANKTHATYQWVLEPAGEMGLYRIRCQNSGMYLTADSFKERAQVVQTASPGNAALWEVNEVRDGLFCVINFQTGMAITRGAVGEYGLPTDVYEVQTAYTGADNQLWGFEYYSEKELHSVTVDPGIQNGTVTANYRHTVSGETVYLTVTPDQGYEMTEGTLTVNGEAVPGTSFVMPDADVTVTAEFEVSEITGISVKTQPDKTEYSLDEALDLTGLVLEAEYPDGSTRDITAGYQISRVDMSRPGTKEVTVTYAGRTAVLEIQVLAGENYTTSGVIYSAPSSSYFDPARPSSRNSVLSPRGLQLKYQDNEADNGKMLVTWETSVVELLPERQGKFLPIYESTDYGENWTEVGRIVEDTEKQDWPGDWEIENCPHIFELPADVGEMKKGGIVAVMDVCPRDLSLTYMDMYYSGDMGRTWEYVSTLVDDATNNYMGYDPVWEPFILYDPVTEALVVYYSDERDPRYGQKLVLQYTTDGKNWSEVIDVVAQTDTSMRPGMPVVAQMENGYYVMVFEGVGLNADGAGGQAGLPCNYKISLYPNDPIHWDAADIGYTFAYGGNPYVATLPDGHIVMNVGTQSPVYINTQKDLSGVFLTYPSGVTDGYNRQFIMIDDGTEKGALMTLSCEYPDTGRPNSIKWGKLDLNTVTIPDTKATLYDINISEETSSAVNVWPKAGPVIAGADQYFMIQPRRGHQISRVLVNGQEVHLYNSWIKVPAVNADIDLTVETTQASSEARIINTKEDPQFYLVPPGYSMVDGREIFEWTLENNIHFYWTLEPDAGTGAYRIKNMNTNMYLSVKDGSTAEGANIIQTMNTGDASLWELNEAEDGWFSIINYNSGLAVTRGEPGAYEGPNERFAIQTEYTGADNQLWGLDYVLEDTQLYSVTIDSAVQNGTVTANHKNAACGETVFVSAVPDEGYELAGLQVNGQDISGNSFVMPEGDAVITSGFVADNTVSELLITSMPARLNYHTDEELDLGGLVLEAVYEDGSRTEVTAGYEVSDVDMSTPGEKTVTISYGGRTVSFTVAVTEETEEPEQPEVESLTVKAPDQTEYKIGDPLNLDGMTVTAHYSDGSQTVVTDYQVTGFSSDTAGEKTITVSYTENSVTVTDSFTVTVSSAEETPGSGEETPGGTGEEPGSGEENPGGTEETPGSGEQKPGNTQEQPGNIDRQPDASDSRPGSTENPGGGNAGQSGNSSPKTGDSLSVIRETALCVICLAAIGGVSVLRRKRRS